MWSRKHKENDERPIKEGTKVSEHTTRLPAVVTGGGLNALGVVRSLAAGDMAIHVLDNDARSPAMRSRHATAHRVPSLEGEALIEHLLALARTEPTPMVLFPTEEKTVETVSRYREQLSQHFLFRMPPHERLMALMHKQGFQQLAEAIHAPVPRTVYLQSAADLTALKDLNYPCVFKPAEKNYAYGAKFKKAYKVQSAAEIETLYADIEPVMPHMVAQEWIEGEDTDIYFCLQYVGADGEEVASFCGRKLRCWPPRVGGTASCMPAWEVAATLSSLTHDFFRKVGFTGMGSMEYKRDRRDGQFYMVEPTVGRTDFQEEVATLNGINVPLMAYHHEAQSRMEHDSRKQTSAPVRIWRDPLTDRYSMQEQGGASDPVFARYPVVDAYWRWNDPLPWIDMMSTRILAKLRG